MDETPIDIPDFMKKYYMAIGREGQVQLERIAHSYETERQDFMQNKYPAKAIFQDQWNKLTGQNVRLDPEKLTWPIREKHRVGAEQVALANGYQEQRPAIDAEHLANPKQKDDRPQQPPASRTESGDVERNQTHTGKIPHPKQPEVQPQTLQAAPNRAAPQSSTVALTADEEKRQQFRAQLNAMREQGQRLTQRPK